MKFHLFASALIAGAASISIPSYAVPAKPGIIRVTTADGTELPVRLVGDENFHYYLTEDGYPLVESEGKYFYGRLSEDGNVISTGVKAKAVADRTAADRTLLKNTDLKAVAEALDRQTSLAPRRRLTGREIVNGNAVHTRASSAGFTKGPGLMPGSAFPSIGEQKALVILVEYADVKFELDDPYDYFSRLLNEPGFKDYGGTGSAADYFKESSSGLFQPDFDVYGPVTLSKNMVFYGGNTSGNDANPAMMVVEACQQLDATVDFSQYDRDNDGYIDNVFLFYAGRGEATGGSADTVWPHSWAITNAYPTRRYEFDGVILDHYACSNEWEEGHPDGVGTFVHEFSHVLGLPDLYTTAYTNAFTPGSWSALDYGPYNNQGRTPPLYGAYERYALGWMAPAQIKEAMHATLPPIGTNVAGIIRTDSDYEFFLLENRQKTSWDTYIPGHGMLIWHIDYNIGIWRENTVNNSNSHQYVDIEEADNLKNTATRDGDTFPGYDNVTSFTDNTTPSMRTWGGAALNLPLTEIAESEEGIITFLVKGGGEPLAGINALEAKDVTDLGFTACWEPSSDGSDYVINIYTRDPEGAATYLPGYFMRPVSGVTELTVDDMEAETEYFYTVQAARGLEVSTPSAEISVFTSSATIRREKVRALEAENVTDDAFTARWEPLEGASTYSLSVFTKGWDGQRTESYDFTDGVNPLPTGWQSSSTSTFANNSYSGAALPSLRLSADDRLTVSPGDDVRSLTFWHRGSSTSEGDVIIVYAGMGGNVRTEVASVPVITTKGGVVTVIDQFPEGAESVRLEYRRAGSKGSVAIDDVTVGYGYTYQPHFLDGYEELTVGDVTSFRVTGLEDGTDYFYTVRGVDGELMSRPSDEVRVSISSNTGIDAPAETAVNNVTVEITERTLTVNAPAGGLTTVHDTLGRLVATGEGSFSVQLQVAGCYIVSTPAGVSKLIVK